MMNVFYFILKAHFVLKIFTSFPDAFGCIEKQLDEKAKVNLKNYKSQTGTQAITINMLLKSQKVK